MGDEAEEVSKGLPAKCLARDVKEPDTHPSGQWFFIFTALESLTGFQKPPVWSLSSTPIHSGLIGLGWGQDIGISEISPGISSVQPGLRSIASGNRKAFGRC